MRRLLASPVCPLPPDYSIWRVFNPLSTRPPAAGSGMVSHPGPASHRLCGLDGQPARVSVRLLFRHHPVVADETCEQMFHVLGLIMSVSLTA